MASTLVAKPAYYRPVVVDGKAFPVARSNYLALVEFPDSWHAPRLRLVNGKWLLVGVHEGIDILAERGTPVISMEPGVVENVGWTFYSGTRVGVRGVDARYYFYAHLSHVEPGIVVGAKVSAGTAHIVKHEDRVRPSYRSTPQRFERPRNGRSASTGSRPRVTARRGGTWPVAPS